MATRLEFSSAYKQRDTGPAKLPGLPAVSTGNPALDSWLRAATERLEVREGSRGNAAERVVTQRELQEINLVVEALKDSGKEPGVGTVKLELGGGLTATLAIQKFEDLIRATKLYQDLKKRLDDPSRFDELPAAVREYVLRRLSDEAAARGTAISAVERIINERFTSMAIRVDTLTSSLDEANAGLRETRWTVSETNRAQAGKITQLEASLGNFYQDGTPGRALLEEQMTATADRLAGLSAQYTLKVQAGGALAGFGLSATEVDGVPSSAFIIAADKFAIVNPLTYSSGLTNTPDTAHIPFGVDANGIYMNNNVYVKGQMRVDAGGRTLDDGLRGSLMVDNGAGTWSDSAARQAVWAKLGKTGTALNNNHLVIGDQVRIGATVRMWLGASWGDPGVVINGNMVVDGSLAARHIKTNGLTIKDAWGNVIFGAGVNLDMSRINGLGDLASQDDVRIGDKVKFPDGTTMATSDFVNRLSKINATTIGTFMDNAAIGNAYIGNAAVGTLTLGRNAVTIPYFLSSGDTYIPAQGTALLFDTYVDLGPTVPGGAFGGSGPSGCTLVQFSFFMNSQDDGWGVATIYLDAGAGHSINFGVRVSGGGNTDMCMPVTHSVMFPGIFGSHRITCRVSCIPNSAGGWHAFTVRNPRLSIFGGKR